MLLSFSLTQLATTADFGPDGVPCTSDDVAIPGVGVEVGALPTALTTGSAQATIMQSVITPPGGCSGDAGSTTCTEDANCAVTNGGPGGTCSAPAPTRIPGCSGDAGLTVCIEDANCAVTNGGPGGTCSAPAPILTTATLGPMTGSAGSCANYEAGNMGNVTFVAATTYVGTPTNVVYGFRLKCQ